MSKPGRQQHRRQTSRGGLVDLGDLEDEDRRHLAVVLFAAGSTPRLQWSTLSRPVRCRWHRHLCPFSPRIRVSPSQKKHLGGAVRASPPAEMAESPLHRQRTSGKRGCPRRRGPDRDQAVDNTAANSEVAAMFLKTATPRMAAVLSALAGEARRTVGPAGLIPVQRRWSDLIPDVDPSKFVALKALCHSVLWTPAGWHNDLLAQRPPHASNEVGEILQRMIATKYPFLTREAQRATASYAVFVNR